MTSSPSPVIFLPLGALIQSFTVANHNIALGFPTQSLYSKYNAPFFGETIGRYGNRISNGMISSLNSGKSYPLAKNGNGVCTLHGGNVGWGKKIWEGPEKVERNGRVEVEFRYVSVDGEEGFPGTVECRVWYFVESKDEGRDVSLEVEYEVELIGEEVEETAVNVTNHGYWNVSPTSTTTGTVVTFSTILHQPIDTNAIPTGAITSFPGITANVPLTLGPKDPFIDHCFILDPKPNAIPLDTRSRPLLKAVEIYHPDTGLHLSMETTEPAFQFYTGEGINVPEIGAEEVGERKVEARGARAGVAIEPSRYVDAVNNEEWKGMVVLKRGKKWGSKSRFRGWVE